jgi:hypothetical protein
MIYYYENGERTIPRDFAEGLREEAALGPAGQVLKRTLMRIMPEQPVHIHHKTARELEHRLAEADVLR